MPTMKPNFSYAVSNTYVTNSGEGRLVIDVSLTETSNNEGESITITSNVAQFTIGVGNQDPTTANAENLLISSAPQFFE